MGAACAGEFAWNILAVGLLERFTDRLESPCWYEAPNEPVTAFMFWLLNTQKVLREQIQITQNKLIAQIQSHAAGVLLTPLLISFFSRPGFCLLSFSVFKSFKVL